MLHLRTLLIALWVLVLAGCAQTYIPPGPKADLQAMAQPDIRAGFEAKPSSPFPASVALVRVQGSGYANHRVRQNGGLAGSGRYSVMLVREVEQEAQFEFFGKLPQVAGVVTLNRLLVPAQLNDDKDIRQAASRLQADLVFLYTFATEFFDITSTSPAPWPPSPSASDRRSGSMSSPPPPPC